MMSLPSLPCIFNKHLGMEALPEGEQTMLKNKVLDVTNNYSQVIFFGI